MSDQEPITQNFDFTNNWFNMVAGIWDQLLVQIKPRRILEIGSYEGQCICYLIGKLASETPLEIHSIDTFEGGGEHAKVDMGKVESRFNNNVKLAASRTTHAVNITKHKGMSDAMLVKLLAEGKKNYFDLIYIDGSHHATDVLCDAVLSFRLLKVGGVIIFDDYIWQEQLESGNDLVRSPKVAIDAFTNIYYRKLRYIIAPLYQLYVQKTSD